MKRLGWVFFLLGLVPQLGLARGKMDRWDNLNRLQVGEKITAVDSNSTVHRGTFVSFSADSITLRTDGLTVPIQRANVQRVVSHRPRRLRNIAIAAAIGVGSGIAIGIPLWIAEGATAFPGALAPIVGGGAGAGIGAAVPFGSRTIYKVKKLRRAAP